MEAPQDYKTAGTVLIVSGALNALTGLIWGLSLLIVCVGVFWLALAGVGVWQIMVGMKMMNGEKQEKSKPAAIAGIVAGVLNFNILSAGAAGYAMMLIGKPEVAGYLEE